MTEKNALPEGRAAGTPCPEPSLIGITMGCPVGVGPEIVLKFMDRFGSGVGNFRPVVLGDLGVLKRCAVECELDLEFVAWQPGRPPAVAAETIVPVLACSTLAADSLEWGRPTRETGRAMAVYIEQAARLVLQGELAAMVTCPISKAALQAAGYQYPGHTEMLAALCGTEEYAMMMAGEKLRVALVTIHVPLAEVPALINQGEVLKLIRMVGRSLRRDFGVSEPRIGVAGLNPHAGEGGIFGQEESSRILPAVEEARAEGWTVDGPLPPDTVFYKAAAGAYDAVVCMYHDQGLIPFKLLHFADGVNLTLGLPLVRTSVDHGTAYDIAGRGVASPASLAAAFRMAAEIAINRQKSS